MSSFLRRCSTETIESLFSLDEETLHNHNNNIGNSSAATSSSSSSATLSLSSAEDFQTRSRLASSILRRLVQQSPELLLRCSGGKHQHHSDHPSDVSANRHASNNNNNNNSSSNLTNSDAQAQQHAVVQDEEVAESLELVYQSCQEYLNRYQRRMTLLRRYEEDPVLLSDEGEKSTTVAAGGNGAPKAGESSSSPSASPGTGKSQQNNKQQHWTIRVQDYYERPLLSKPGRALFGVHCILALWTTLSLTLRSFPSLSPIVYPELADTLWNPIDGLFLAIYVGNILGFTLSALLRPERPLRQRFMDCFAVGPNVCDMVAVGASIVAIGTGKSVSGLQQFRWLSFTRIGNGLRHFYVFEDMFETLRNSTVPLFGPVVAVVIFVIAFASVMYTLESGSYEPSSMRFMTRNDDCEMKPPYLLGVDSCTRTESLFLSVLHSMWFSLIALLTVGYGDVVPKTMGGRAAALVCIVLGQLLMAMPIAIIQHNFTNAVAQLKFERSAMMKFMEARRRQRRALLPTATNSTSTIASPLGVPQGSTREQQGPPRIAGERTPAVCFFRFLRFALKCRVLDLHLLDRMVAYSTDFYFLTVAQRLRSTAAAEGDRSPAGGSANSSNSRRQQRGAVHNNETLTAAAASFGEGDNNDGRRCSLALMHNAVAHIVEIQKGPMKR